VQKDTDAFEEQLRIESVVLREMNPVRDVQVVYEHLPVKINRRSSVNIYKDS